MNNPKLHICPDCNSQMFQRFNSYLWFCPTCENSRKYVKVGTLHTSKKTGVKKGLKSLKTKSPRQRAMDRADEYFSKYIRFKHAHPTLMGTFVCRCYTCNNLHDIKIIECGHYHSRENKATRYHENNARAQCTHCNQHKHGRHTEFGNNLLGQIGFEEFEELRKLALSTGEDNEIFYREQAKIYRLKFNQLVKEKGCNPWN
jgi:hypothetical protein